MSSEQQLTVVKANGDADSVASSHPQSAIHFGHVQYYGQIPESPSGHESSWNAHSNPVNGHRYSQIPTQYYTNGGQTRIVNGQMTTTFRGVETTMSTHEYLNLTPEKREMVGNAGHYPHYNDYKRIAPSPDEPPPPPKVEITTPSTKEEKKCINGECGSTTDLAMIHGVAMCHKCIENSHSITTRLVPVQDWRPARG